MNYKPWVSWGVYGGATASQRACYFASWGTCGALQGISGGFNISVLVSGVWKKIERVYLLVSGVWRDIPSANIKELVSGVWKSI